jgi:hypothetical protein
LAGRTTSRQTGQRFLMVKDDQESEDARPRIIIVQNWTEELKRLVPTN